MIPVNVVLDALAQHLHNEGVAVFSPDGIYLPDVAAPAVFFGQLAAAPDQAVAVAHYNTDPDIFTQQTNPLLRVQLRWRAGKDPRTVTALADNGATVLHSQTPGEWPGRVRPVWVVRTITGLLETDQNGRWMRADSYDIRLNPIGA